MKDIMGDPVHHKILATTMKKNINSIHLLEKAGFQYDRNILRDGKQLMLYEITAKKLNL